MQAGQGIVWDDERKRGLRGQVRQVGPPRGVAVSQAVQIGWKYIHVAVVLDPMTGRLWWAWRANMKDAEMTRIRGAWARKPDIDGWVWDGARGHTGKDRQAVAAPPGVRPPCAPEPNPVERFFRKLRRAVEGRVDPTLQAKQDALEPILEAWQRTPSGCGSCVAGTGPGMPWRP